MRKEAELLFVFLEMCHWSQFALTTCLFQEKEMKHQLRLDGVRLRDTESGLITRKAAFALFNPDHK